MTITKVLIAAQIAVRHQGGLGDGRSVKIAHCVGGVDKSTLSENLGAGVDRRRERRPQIAAALVALGGRM